MSSWPNLLQSPGVPSHTQVREPQSAMRHQEQPPVQGVWSPCSAMEGMNQSGQPRKSGKRGPMQPAPLTSGGLALEEITCRGWGPHLQYSFLINFFVCLRMWRKNGAKEPQTPHPWGSQHMPSPPFKNLGISILRTPTSPNHVAEVGARVSSP